MSTKVSFHNPAFALRMEIPGNGFSMTLDAKDGGELSIFCADLEEWWRLRAAFPKAKAYTYHPHTGNEFIEDGEKADRLAELYYHEERLRVAKREAARIERENAAAVSEAAA